MNQVDRAGNPVTVHFPHVLLSSTTTSTSGAEHPDSHLAESETETLFRFSDLPPEIRRLIWEFTFTPRILHIKLHKGKTDPNIVLSVAHPWRDSAELAATCIYFTVREGLMESPHPFQILETLRQLNKDLGYNDVQCWTLDPGMKAQLRLGPVALHVCHESRVLALKHYELAFAGTNFQPDTDTEFAAVWKKAGYGERRIWINFEVDTIFVSDESSSKHPLTAFTRYAGAEMKKIRWLSFSEMSTQLYNPSGPLWRLDTLDDLEGFENLKEITVYHLPTRGPLPDDPFWPAGEFDESLRDLRQRYLEALEEQKRNHPKWTTDLPAVVVRMGHPFGYNWETRVRW